MRCSAGNRRIGLAGISGALACCLVVALSTLGCASGAREAGAPDARGPDAATPTSSPSPASSPSTASSPSAASAELAAGWADLMAGLEAGRRALEDPAFVPPEPTDRNLAEGYRYLLGHLARIIEAETEAHPDFPSFRRSISMLAKWTIENPDTMYLSATIDADGVYRVRGRALDTTAWRTSQRDLRGPRAPRVVIFQTTTAVVGQTGRLEEMAECRNQTLDALDQFSLEVDEAGRFEILVAAARPEGHRGHFLATRAELPCRDRSGGITMRLREATQLNVREIFSDWDEEVPLELEIVRLDRRGAARPPRTPEEMSRHLSEIGRRLASQIAFWNRLHEYGLEVRGDRNGDGRLAFPLNALNPPAPPFIAGGTAGAGQLYAAGSFELAEDEALVVRVEAPDEPHYVGFQLGNLWGEGPDQANYVSSLSGSQNPVASDGARWYVVSARDPGTPGWVDTTGLPKGTTGMRFLYRDPPPADRLPTVESFVVKVDDVRSILPADTPHVTPEARREQVHARQLHIQRRWRQY